MAKAANQKKNRKHNWVAIKKEWLGGASASDIYKKYDIVPINVYNKIKQWIAEGSLPEDKGQKGFKLEDETFAEMWEQLGDLKLTEKQKMFAIYYCVNGGNRKDAVLKAKYSVKPEHTGPIAHKLLNTESVKEAIKILKPKLVEDKNVESEDVVGFMAAVATSDISDFIDWGIKSVTRYTRQGIPYEVDVPYVKIKDKGQMDTRLIKSIKATKEGNFELELYDKKWAMEFFMKYHSIIEENAEETVENKLAQGLLEMAKGFSNQSKKE